MTEHQNDGQTAAANPHVSETLVRIVPAKPVTPSGYTLFTGLECVMPNGEVLPGVTRIVLTGEHDSLWHARIDMDIVPPELDAVATFAAAESVVPSNGDFTFVFSGSKSGSLPRAIAVDVQADGLHVTPGEIVTLKPDERVEQATPRRDAPYTCHPQDLPHTLTEIGPCGDGGTLFGVASLAGCMRVVRTEPVRLHVEGPRVTEALLRSAIANVYYFTAAQGVHKAAFDRSEMLGGTIDAECMKPIDERLMTLTMCVILLRDGTAVTGESAPARSENFDVGLGRVAAYNNAFAKLWPLFGVLLRDRSVSAP